MTSRFQKKIFLNISLIMVLFLLGLILVFSRDSYAKLSESRNNNLLTLASQTAGAFSSLLQDMDAIALHLASNANIREVFYRASREPMTNAEIYSDIKDDFIFLLVPVDTARFRISLYNAEGNFICAGIPYSGTDVREFLSSSAFDEYYDGIVIPKSRLLSGFHRDRWSHSDTEYLSSLRELSASSNSKKRVALIEIECNYRTVDSILSLVQSDTSTFLLDPSGQAVYSSLTEQNAPTKELLASYIGKRDSLTEKVYGDSQNIVTAVELSGGWRLMLIQSLQSPAQLMKNYLLLTLITAAVCLSSALFIVFIVIRNNTKPLQELTRSVNRLSLQSPFLNMDPASCSDELLHLTEAFNQMVNKLTLSLEENARARECEMRANLVALQSQMDPHFLYNMLSVINSYDSEEDMDKVHQICLYMSSMLRYISSYMDNTATLSMELTHTEHYLRLMKFRFEDQFDYEIQINSSHSAPAGPATDPGMEDDPEMEAVPGTEADPEIAGSRMEQIQVPRLILQPILENCFQHGFKKTLPPWRIRITLQMPSENEWSVCIEDNGCGFSREKQEELARKLESFADRPLRSIESLKIGGMGLVNTLVRLRFFLKESFYYRIDAPAEGGTRIWMGGKG